MQHKALNADSMCISKNITTIVPVNYPLGDCGAVDSSA